jgi:hypothetical protein
MSEIVIKLAELVHVVYAVAYVSLPERRVSVWANGSRLAFLHIDPFVTDAEAQAEAEAALRTVGWSVAGDWTRPSEEWTEYRVEVLGTEDIGEVPPGWATIEA